MSRPPVILFPHEPSSPDTIDSEFVVEVEAARSVGFSTGFYDHKAVAAGNPKEGLASLCSCETQQSLILRGWMLPGQTYSSLYSTLVTKNYCPVTAPDDYAQAHYLPFAYPLIDGHTPRSAWIEGDDPDAAWELYQGFRAKDSIIKDWVKSAKKRWQEACYIPANTDETRFREIYRAFRAERGKLFNRGVVLREFMPIVERGSDIRGLPIVEEIRLFFWQGKVLVRPEERSPSPMDEADRWEEIASRFTSPFITIDVAYLTDGTWKIVEVGDGGVSGLPMGMEPTRFYAALWEHTKLSCVSA